MVNPELVFEISVLELVARGNDEQQIRNLLAAEIADNVKKDERKYDYTPLLTI